MEGRWASLTLSALYDRAIDLHNITRDDTASLVLETLLHKEAARRQSSEFLLLQSMVIAGSTLSENRNELLLDILQQGQGDQPGHTPETPSPATEMEQYEDFYQRLTDQVEEEDKMRDNKDG